MHAVNVTFGRDNPFLLPDIRFEAAHAAAHDGGALCVQDEEHNPKPFQLHLFPGNDGKKWYKGDLERVAAEHAAGRIVRLLELGASGKALVRRASGPAAGIPLAAGDIAVLVRTGKQGRAVAHALRQGGVRTVELGTDSVFDSAEAVALHQLLHALAADESDYNAAARLRGALAGDLFGLDLHAIDRLQEDDQAWAAWNDRAREWRGIWARDGIASLLRHLLFADRPACATNLLRYPDGPRRLTNFLHLTDLLHDAETRDRLSRRGLLMDWFAHFKAQPERGRRNRAASPGERREPGEDRHGTPRQGTGVSRGVLPVRLVRSSTDHGDYRRILRCGRQYAGAGCAAIAGGHRQAA